MPSGKTHDRITLWSLPIVTGLTFAQTQSSNLTLLVSGGFLFGGLMFGPDLDIYSRQYQRWGWLRWIWIPYQKTLRHRSFLSHGLVIGTTLRIIYLVTWLGILSIFLLGIAQLLWDVNWSWEIFAKSMQRSLTQYPAEWIALLLGLELGAISHSLSDWCGSIYSRFQKQRSLNVRRGKIKQPTTKYNSTNSTLTKAYSNFNKKPTLPKIVNNYTRHNITKKK